LPGAEPVSVQARTIDAGTPVVKTLPANPLPVADPVPRHAAPPAPAPAEAVATVPAPSAPVHAGPLVKAAATPATRPTATHIVAPEYPAFARGGTERVEVSFTIGSNGGVRDIAIASADVDAAFKRAAERALRQWRFDPATLAAGGSLRYTQVFVFTPGGKRKSGDEPDCVQATGSHICRLADEASRAAVARR
jgi:protein TonB